MSNVSIFSDDRGEHLFVSEVQESQMFSLFVSDFICLYIY